MKIYDYFQPLISVEKIDLRAFGAHCRLGDRDYYEDSGSL
jgi:hypothetical protein